MPDNKTAHRLSISYSLREWAIPGLFCCLTLIMLYPLSIHLTSMVPEPTDPLLNVWRMQWNARAFLGGPAAIANLFDTNIFYPFPLTLAYSEHFLMMSAQMLPFLVLADSHLLGMNLAVLLTFILSGYGMYLLMTDWTANRWAGLTAAVLFAYSPYRFGQLNHLELLVTEWMPLSLLALHWTMTRPGRRYPLLFILFFNLQALSGFHYALNLTIACGLLALVYSLTGRVHWRPGLWLAAALSVAVTLLFNWPIWRMYLHFSDVMGAIRTPGEVRIYSAALTDYFTAIPYNLLYGWTFGRWSPPGHQFQPLMPFGLIGLLLALAALSHFGFWILDFGFSIVSTMRQVRCTTPHALRTTPYILHFIHRRPSAPFYASKSSLRPGSTQLSIPHPLSSILYPPSSILFCFLLTLLALLLSFGLNENALGPGLTPLLTYSPYFWFYEHIPFFQGIRVPGRYGLLVVIGLVGLAGWGAAWLLQVINRHHSSFIIHHASTLKSALALGVIGLILLESWSAPLVGPQFPAGRTIPPVYRWLTQETPAEAVVLELPFQGTSEFLYEYYSSYHWRRLANGGSGFTPPIYKLFRQWVSAFPDPRSMDVIQQLGIDVVILHQAAYSPEAWQQLMADLPLYLPAIEQIEQLDNDWIIRIAKPLCHPDPDQVEASLSPAELDGLPNVAAVTYHNRGPAAFTADVRQVSRLKFGDGSQKNFTEPLVTPAGERQTVVVPLRDELQKDNLAAVWLATLNRTASIGDQAVIPQPFIEKPANWQPLALKFADGPELAAYRLGSEGTSACGQLALALQWEGGQPGDTALVQLLDPFGRPVVEDEDRPWDRNGNNPIDLRSLPLVGTLPGGRYGLRVLVRAADGVERLPITDEGVTIPTTQIPPLPVVIHPPDVMPGPGMTSLAASFENGMTLSALDLAAEPVAAGDWLHFSLVWQVEQPLAQELTVFTQLLGPDGQVWGQRDNRPGGGWYGVPLWRPGRPVVDHYAFQIQKDAPPGLYRLIVGLYQSDTQERVRLQTGGDFVEATVLQIGPSSE